MQDRYQLQFPKALWANWELIRISHNLKLTSSYELTKNNILVKPGILYFLDIRF